MSIDVVEDISPRVQYVAFNGQTDFDYPFPIFDDGDVKAYVDDVAVSNFTVAGVGDDNGGSIHFLTSLTANQIVTIYRDTAVDRLTDAQMNGPNSSQSFNDELDRIILMIQEAKASNERSLRFSITSDVNADNTLLNANDLINKLLGFDSSGRPYGVDPGSLGTIVAYGTAVTDVFVATEGQITFALTQNPGAIGNLDITLDGATLVPTIDFSWTGTTLTIIGGCSAGQRVYARYMKGLPTGVTEAIPFYDRTAFETSAGVSIVNTDVLSGYVRRYGTNSIPGTTDMTAALNASAAQAAIGGASINIDSALRITADVTLPAGINVVGTNGPITVDTGKTLTINGRFSAPRIPMFNCVGTGKVVFAKGMVNEIFPQWYGAAGNATTTDGTTGTDNTAAMLAAVRSSSLDGAGAVAIHPINIGSGSYMMSNITFPPASTIRGGGRQTTNIIAKVGTVGKFWTDTGSASKIIVEKIAFYCAGAPGITHGLQLGRNGTSHGTEGYVREIWMNDVTNGIGCDFGGNIAMYDTISIYRCATNIVVSSGKNFCKDIVSYGATVKGADFNLATVLNIEVEAPAAGCIPILLSGNTNLISPYISLQAGLTISHLIEFAAGCTTWKIDDFESNIPSSVTISNQSFKRADGTYFGGKPSSTNGLHVTDGSYDSRDAGLRKQNFRFRIINTAGTLQHRMATSGATASNFVSCVNAASAALQNTNAGADATAMTFGGKISEASPSIFWFDVAAQKIADDQNVAYIETNSSGTALTVKVFLQSVTINAVTAIRLGLQFFNATTGAAVDLTTGNIASGKLIDVNVQAFLSPLAN